MAKVEQLTDAGLYNQMSYVVKYRQHVATVPQAREKSLIVVKIPVMLDHKPYILF